MASYNISGSDDHVQNQLELLKSGVATYSGALGLLPAQVTQINDACDDFVAALTASEEAKAVASGAVAAKNEQRALSVEVARFFAAFIKASPAATPAILAACGINPSVTPGGEVGPVNKLTATAYTNGTAELSWDRTGNPQGTTFIIEAQINESPNWTAVGVTTKVKFMDEAAVVGTPRLYRVRSMKGDITSAPSNEASIYMEAMPDAGLMAA
ncbi:MAG: hypothetical protein JNK63_10385 [Chthonomonas sp.]|nr:hypothetical protein [Chthonomonas sp.]